MAEKNTHSILETIKNKLNKFDQKTEKTSKLSEVSDEFEYIAPKQIQNEAVENPNKEFLDDEENQEQEVEENSDDLNEVESFQEEEYKNEDAEEKNSPPTHPVTNPAEKHLVENAEEFENPEEISEDLSPPPEEYEGYLEDNSVKSVKEVEPLPPIKAEEILAEEVLLEDLPHSSSPKEVNSEAEEDSGIDEEDIEDYEDEVDFEEDLDDDEDEDLEDEEDLELDDLDIPQELDSTKSSQDSKIEELPDFDEDLDLEDEELFDEDQIDEAPNSPEIQQLTPKKESEVQSNISQNSNINNKEDNYESELETLERELEEQEKKRQEDELKFTPKLEAEAAEEDIELELEKELRGFNSQNISAKTHAPKDIEKPIVKEEVKKVEEIFSLEENHEGSHFKDEVLDYNPSKEGEVLTHENLETEEELLEELELLEKEKSNNSIIKMDNKSEKKILNEDTIMQASDSIRKLIDAKNVVAGISNFAQSPALKDLATNMLEPRLERWLNENLANMVEEIVREEIKKILPKE